MILIGMAAWRAVMEEHTLQEDLKDDAYMSHVKYRLIPYFW
jgi:protein-S-isoprenylcysteine O-methyltransferase Ste14